MGRFNSRFSRNFNWDIMNKIATHDSGTGEKSKNFLHRLFKPFAKTQTKTIAEQWNMGVRYFDLRVNDKFVISHGLWQANKNVYDILSELNVLALGDITNKTYIMITIERNYNNWKEIADKLKIIVQCYPNIHCVSINRKYPKWECIYNYNSPICAKDYVSVPSAKEYLMFKFKNWKKYIPMPKVLNKIYKRQYEFNNKYFVMVDFI